MEATITIKIEVDEDFDKNDLLLSLHLQFVDITGYEIEDIEVDYPKSINIYKQNNG